MNYPAQRTVNICCKEIRHQQLATSLLLIRKSRQTASASHTPLYILQYAHSNTVNLILLNLFPCLHSNVFGVLRALSTSVLLSVVKSLFLNSPYASAFLFKIEIRRQQVEFELESMASENWTWSAQRMNLKQKNLMQKLKRANLLRNIERVLSNSEIRLVSM